MGRSRCRRGRQYGDEWQRQHGGGKLNPQFNGATISFVFLKCQKKRLFLFFSRKVCRPLKSVPLGGRLGGQISGSSVAAPLSGGSYRLHTVVCADLCLMHKQPYVTCSYT
jgi:hypothetical protein